MSVDLFERYRDALRRGHVSAARGELETAAAAYAEAISLARDRPVAHAGLGAIHLRKGDLRAGLREFDLALARAPRDEASLAGRADALTGLGRRADAAETLDRLAAVLEAAGKSPEALDMARRALALAEGKSRRRQVERLAERVEGPASTAAVAAGPEEAGDGEAETGEAADGTAVAAGSEAEPAAPVKTVAEPPAPIVDGVERMTEAEDAYERGDLELARREALVAAEAFRRQGQQAAAIDACYLALTVAPDDAALHLVLVSLYLERGWRGRAAEKLLLLGRLAELDGNEEARVQLCAVVAAEFPGNPQLAALCA